MTRDKRKLTNRVLRKEVINPEKRDSQLQSYHAEPMRGNCGKIIVKGQCLGLRRIREKFGYLPQINADMRDRESDFISEEVEQMFAEHEYVTPRRDLQLMGVNILHLGDFIEQDAAKELSEKLDPTIYNARIDNLARRYNSNPVLV
jgi:hypothetical protein